MLLNNLVKDLYAPDKKRRKVHLPLLLIMIIAYYVTQYELNSRNNVQMEPMGAQILVHKKSTKLFIPKGERFRFSICCSKSQPVATDFTLKLEYTGLRLKPTVYTFISIPLENSCDFPPTTTRQKRTQKRANILLAYCMCISTSNQKANKFTICHALIINFKHFVRYKFSLTRV